MSAAVYVHSTASEVAESKQWQDSTDQRVSEAGGKERGGYAVNAME